MSWFFWANNVGPTIWHPPFIWSLNSAHSFYGYVIYATWYMLRDICYVRYIFLLIIVTVCALITAYSFIMCINPLVQSCFLIRTTPVWALLERNYQLRRYAAHNRKAAIETSLFTGNNYGYQCVIESSTLFGFPEGLAILSLATCVSSIVTF